MKQEYKNSPLAGKVLWLTGASSGIGEAFARQVAKTGCRLALTARRKEVLDKLAEELRDDGAEAVAVPGDVTQRREMKEAVAEIEERLGAIDIVVANAGTHIPTDVTSFDVPQYERIISINFFGAIKCIEAVLPKMIERKQGHLVCVSSVAGYRGLPQAAAYGASKAALTHFCESIRFDLEPLNIDVSIVSPGFVRTPLTDMNEFEMPFLMEAEDAARALVAGIEKRKHEIHFPKIFTYIVKTLRVLPYPLYHWFIRRSVCK